MSEKQPAIDISEILRYLPHRYPFLLIDRVTEIDLDARIVAIKNVTINEPFFQGHFPHVPVMPGVLVLEAMAQAAGILSFASMGRYSDANSVYYFAGIDEARFKRPVSPGDSWCWTCASPASRGSSGSSTARPPSMARRWPRPA